MISLNYDILLIIGITVIAITIPFFSWYIVNAKKYDTMKRKLEEQYK
jgi:hypothetical protein